MTNAPERKLLWCDHDIGHDDSIALLLALYEPSISLMGVSTVHGNAGVHHTTINAAKCLEAFGAPASIKVYPGAAKPLIGEAHPAVDIHGNDGLGGVEGLPDASDPRVQARIMDASDPVFQGGLPAIVGMRDAALSALSQGKKLYLGVTGSCTNAALFLSAYPALAKQAIAQIVCMGGGVGIGNITAAAEFNIYVDPFAAQIVLDCGLPVSCIPLNVTHQMLFHADAQRHLLDPLADASASDPAAPMPAPATPLRYTLSTLMTFFANTYRDVFGFQDGPPIHDALVVAYLAHPELFSSVKCRVDVELGGEHSRGAYIVDVYNRKPGQVLNAEMARALDVPAILRTFFTAFEKADHASPLNAGLKTIPVDVQVPNVAVRAALPPPLL